MRTWFWPLVVVGIALPGCGVSASNPEGSVTEVAVPLADEASPPASAQAEAPTPVPSTSSYAAAQSAARVPIHDGTATITADQNETWVIGYACQWDGRRWWCGCRTSQCAAQNATGSLWQAQLIKKP